MNVEDVEAGAWQLLAGLSESKILDGDGYTR